MTHYTAPGILTLEPLTADDVLKAVSKVTEISIPQLKGKTRSRHIAHARHIVCYFLRKELKMHVVRVGELLGDRDHSTVIHACSKIDDCIYIKDEETLHIIREVKRALKSF
jgi:chromosomal replication initiator protein